MTLPLANDILTYSLSGTDAKYFVIVDSVEHPETTTLMVMTLTSQSQTEGALIIKDDDHDAWTSRPRRGTR